MKLFLLYLLCGITCLSAQTGLTFSVSGTAGNTITCSDPQLIFTASSNFSAPVNYVWVSPSFSAAGTTATLVNPGGYTVYATSGTNTATQTLSIYVNTVIPVSSASSTFQIVTGTNSPQGFTFTAISPTVNIIHAIYPPTGGTVIGTSLTYVYYPGGSGTYTHCIINIVNGCASCYPFTLSYGSPGTVGLTGNTTEEDLLFPNPNNGLFSIGLKNPAGHVEIYNSLGALVKLHNFNTDGALVDLRQEPRGIYVLRISTTEGRVRYLKVIKE